MSQDELGHPDREPSLAWYGHPPDGELATPEVPAAGDVTADSPPDMYGRLVTSALLIVGTLLLARSRTFRAVTWRLTKFAVTTWLPARLATEVRKAWREAAVAERPGVDAAAPR